MTIVKFRAYVKSEKVLGRVVGIDFQNHRVSVEIEGQEIRDYEMENVVITQFTGLYDDNGVEIYEGDIVEIQEMNITPYRSVVHYDFMGAWVESHPLRRQLGFSVIQNLSDYCDYGRGMPMEVGGKVGKCSVVGNFFESKINN